MSVFDLDAAPPEEQPKPQSIIGDPSDFLVDHVSALRDAPTEVPAVEPEPVPEAPALDANRVAGELGLDTGELTSYLRQPGVYDSLVARGLVTDATDEASLARNLTAINHQLETDRNRRAVSTEALETARSLYEEGVSPSALLEGLLRVDPASAAEFFQLWAADATPELGPMEWAQLRAAQVEQEEQEERQEETRKRIEEAIGLVQTEVDRLKQAGHFGESDERFLKEVVSSGPPEALLSPETAAAETRRVLQMGKAYEAAAREQREIDAWDLARQQDTDWLKHNDAKPLEGTFEERVLARMGRNPDAALGEYRTPEERFFAGWDEMEEQKAEMHRQMGGDRPRGQTKTEALPEWREAVRRGGR